MTHLRWLIILCFVPALMADKHSVDADPDTDFSQFRTFSIRQGILTTRKQELNSPLVKQRIEDAIRDQLTAKGLHAEPQGPDLIVNFRLGAADRREVQSWPTGRFGRGRRYETYQFTEGTLVIDLLERDGRNLVWRGIYTDEEGDAAKLAKKLTDDVKKLFEEYPPKK